MRTPLLEHLLEMIRTATPCVLVTPIRRSGSIPCPEHASLLVTRDDVNGTVGGGILEAQAIQTARKVLLSGTPVCTAIRLDAEIAADDGMLCGGTTTFLFEPVPCGEADCWLAADDAVERRMTGAFIVDIPKHESGQIIRRWIPADAYDDPGFTVSDEIRDEIRTGRRMTVVTDAELRFADPLILEDDLLVFGGGHVAHALAPIAAAIGFRVWIIDDRASFVSRDRFPSAYSRIAMDPVESVETLPKGSQVYAVIMTRGHKDDQRILERLLRHELRYIGMIGSLRKKKIIWDTVRSRGADPDRLDGVSCPVGLPLGGSTPAEIAVSIVAELLTVRYDVSDSSSTSRRSDRGVSRSDL